MCITNSSLIVDSIELFDSNGQIIAGPSRNVSFIHYNLTSEMMNSKYICRVNSTLGSRNISIFVNNFEANTQSMTEMTAKRSLVIPIAAASAGTLLILLGIFFILACIISLR